METYTISLNSTPEYPEIEYKDRFTDSKDFLLGYITGIFSLIGNYDEYISDEVRRDPRLSQFNRDLIINTRNHQVNPLGYLIVNHTILEDSDEVPDLNPRDYRSRFGNRWTHNYLAYLDSPRSKMIIQYDNLSFLEGLRAAYTRFGLRLRDYLRSIQTK